MFSSLPSLLSIMHMHLHSDGSHQSSQCIRMYWNNDCILPCDHNNSHIHSRSMHIGAHIDYTLLLHNLNTLLYIAHTNLHSTHTLSCTKHRLLKMNNAHSPQYNSHMRLHLHNSHIRIDNSHCHRITSNCSNIVHTDWCPYQGSN